MSAGFDLSDIRVKGFVSKGPWQVCVAFVLLVRSFVRCIAEVLRFKPAVVLGFGGYSSFPTVVAGRLLGIKTIIHEQNACPGLANRILGRIVQRIAVSFRDTSAFFGGKAVWTGYPARPLNNGRPREQVLRSLGLELGRRTILIFGGSQGSRALNQAFLACLEAVSKERPWQVIHLAGKGGADELRPLYARLPFPVYLRDFMDNMADVYAAADLVIARSGAGTVIELGLLGIPAVLIPYPHANGHQEINAQVLVRHGAASIIREKDLNPAILGDKIFCGLDRPFGGISREAMRLRLSGDFAPDAATRLADEVELL